MAEALLEEGDKEYARDYLDAVVSARGMVKFEIEIRVKILLWRIL